MSLQRSRAFVLISSRLIANCGCFQLRETVIVKHRLLEVNRKQVVDAWATAFAGAPLRHCLSSYFTAFHRGTAVATLPFVMFHLASSRLLAGLPPRGRAPIAACSCRAGVDDAETQHRFWSAAASTAPPAGPQEPERVRLPNRMVSRGPMRVWHCTDTTRDVIRVRKLGRRAMARTEISDGWGRRRRPTRTQRRRRMPRRRVIGEPRRRWRRRSMRRPAGRGWMRRRGQRGRKTWRCSRRRWRQRKRRRRHIRQRRRRWQRRRRRWQRRR